MIEHESNAVRAVAWMEIFQWLNIVRIFRMSIAIGRPRNGWNRSKNVPGRP